MEGALCNTISTAIRVFFRNLSIGLLLLNLLCDVLAVSRTAPSKFAACCTVATEMLATLAAFFVYNLASERLIVTIYTNGQGTVYDWLWLVPLGCVALAVALEGVASRCRAQAGGVAE